MNAGMELNWTITRAHASSALNCCDASSERPPELPIDSEIVVINFSTANEDPDRSSLRPVGRLNQPHFAEHLQPCQNRGRRSNLHKNQLSFAHTIEEMLGGENPGAETLPSASLPKNEPKEVPEPTLAKAVTIQ